jgi:hypothetical protein
MLGYTSATSFATVSTIIRTPAVLHRAEIYARPSGSLSAFSGVLWAPSLRGAASAALRAAAVYVSGPCAGAPPDTTQSSDLDGTTLRLQDSLAD